MRGFCDHLSTSTKTQRLILRKSQYQLCRVVSQEKNPFSRRPQSQEKGMNPPNCHFYLSILISDGILNKNYLFYLT